MNSSAVIQVAPHQVSCELNGEAVILNMESNTYYGLDSTGARIWELIQEPRSFAAICDVLQEEYEIDSASCALQVGEFISQMLAAGLVRVQNE